MVDPAGSGNVIERLRRMDGLRIRVVTVGADAGWIGVAMVVVDVEGPEEPGSSFSLSLSLSRSFSFSFSLSLSFLELGLGGGLCATSARRWSWRTTRLSPSSKSKILAKLSPTLGEESNSLESSIGAGVDSVSPVAVSTTPFMADGR